MRLSLGQLTWFLLAFGFSASVATAAEVTVTFANPPKDEATVSLRSVKRSSDLDGPALRTERRLLTEPLKISLEPGTWVLRVESPSVWHAPQVFTVGNAAMDVGVRLLPSTELRGTVATSNRSPLPTSMQISFVEETNAFSPATIVCPIADAQFSCKLPAGILDLRLHAPGFITIFAWKQNAAYGKVLNLGKVVLRLGAAIIGRVEIDRRLKQTLRDVHVTATPEGVSTRTLMSDSFKLIPITGVVEGNGLFHIDGIPAGRYQVRATARLGLRSRAIPIDVRANLTAEMRDVLSVEEPKELRVFITPSLDPQGNRWHVELYRSVNKRERDPVTSSMASVSGEWSTTRLFAAEYELKIRSIEGNTVWYNKPVVAGDEDRTMTVEIAAQKVRGSVKLAGKPLSATVELARGDSSATFQSNADGEFHGSVKAGEGPWTARIRSAAPPVRHTIKELHIERRDDSDEALLAISLTTAGISGRVVDREGNPVENAIVSMTGNDGVEDVVSAHDGSFSVSGLAGGDYIVDATAFLKSANPVNVRVIDGAVTDGVTIVLQDSVQLHGKVVSEFGAVPGAHVMVAAVGLQTWVRTNVTDAGGEFVALITPDARDIEVLVAAPGFATKAFTTKFVSSKSLTLMVDQRAGTIEIADHQSDGRWPFVVHNGSLYSFAAFTDAYSANGKTILPMMEAGPYAICRLTPAEAAARAITHCHSGFLAPFGTLVIND